MNKLFLVIDQNEHLYQLLKETKFDIQYKLIHSINNIEIEINKIVSNKKDYLIISTNKGQNFDRKKTIYLTKPIKILQLYEKINLSFSKIKFSSTSNISIGKYIFDLNSRSMSYQNKKLKLTEKEVELIIYLYESVSEKRSSDIRKEVWGHSDGVETHTVETHIYRLRKKITETFNDESFITYYNNGYKIK